MCATPKATIGSVWTYVIIAADNSEVVANERLSAALKRLASAVRFRPWPPQNKALSSSQRAKVSVNRTITEHPQQALVLSAILHFHQFPDFPRRASGPGDVLPRQLRIAFGHLDIRVAEDFRELVEIAAVHHVPGRERVSVMPLAA